jgi:hypothetical protein
MMHFFYLAQLFLIIVVPIITKALKALGIGVVSYVGINFVMDQIRSYIVTQVSGNASIVIQSILGLAGFDIAINMYLAAVTTRMVLSGMNKAKSNGKKKDFVLKA